MSMLFPGHIQGVISIIVIKNVNNKSQAHLNETRCQKLAKNVEKFLK